MLLHSFLSLLAVTPVPRKPLRILSPLQKLLIRSHRLRLLPLPPLLLLIRPLLTLPPLPLRNNSATDRFTDKNSKRLPMESLTIFIPVTLLILSYSILLFPSYLITIYISSSLIIFSASLCSSLLFTASPTVRKSPDHNKKPLPRRERRSLILIRYPKFASGILTRSESCLRHFGTTSIPGYSPIQTHSE